MSKFLYALVAVGALVLCALFATTALPDVETTSASPLTVSTVEPTTVEEPTPVPVEPTPTAPIEPGEPIVIPPPSEPVTSGIKYVPWDELPYCPESWDVVGPENTQGEPEFGVAPVCKARPYTPENPGEPKPWSMHGPPMLTPAPTPAPTSEPESFVPSAVQNVIAAAVNTFQHSWASVQLSCSCNTTSNALKGLYASLSSKLPYLSPSKSWNDYHFYNRVHYHESYLGVNCNINGFQFSTLRGVSMGLMYGRGIWATYTGNGMRLMWEKFLPSGCDQIATSYTILPDTSLTTNISTYIHNFSERHLIGYAWINGSWVTIFDVVIPNNAYCNCMNFAETGQELWAENGDKGNIHIPMNFAHKLRLVTSSGTLPWEDDVLPSYLKNETVYHPDMSPFNVMDIVGTNYTSVSSEANP